MGVALCGGGGVCVGFYGNNMEKMKSSGISCKMENDVRVNLKETL